MKVIIRLKGGKGSGFKGHAGRPGIGVGGSAPANTKSFTIRTLEGYSRMRIGERVPTAKEIDTFKNAVSSLSPEIQALRPYKEDILLSVEDGRAESYGSSIYLDEKYLRGFGEGWGLTAEHEYIHTIINTNNGKISKYLERKYKPPYFYRHTDRYGEDMFSKLGEQLVMNLTAFNHDRNIWRDNLMKVERYAGRIHTSEEAQSQIDAIDSFLKGIGLW